MQLYDSLTGIHLDELSEKVGGRYRLTKLISERLKAINSGSPLLVERRENEAILALVCREIEEGAISYDMPEDQIQVEGEDLDIFGLDDDL